MERRGVHIGHWLESQKERGRRRRKWVDNIRMDLRERGLGDIDWIDLAQDRD
jgi:hypothetical protein